MASPTLSPSSGRGDASRRVVFFDGRALTAADLTQEQQYHRERLRRHNRALHGWGVASGLEVTAGGDGGASVVVSPGVAVTAEGDELVVDAPVTIDLAACRPCAAAEGSVVHLAIRYHEQPEGEVPALGQDDAGCDGVQVATMVEGVAFDCLADPPDVGAEWVVLATVQLPATDGATVEVDHETHRRPLAVDHE